MDRTDEELALLAKSGDDAAYEQLVARYARSIFGFARQYARNTEDAEDIAQDAFFKAWKHIGRFKSGKKWKPWLFAIARNTALDHVRKKKIVSFSDMDTEETIFADTLEDTEPLAPEILDAAKEAFVVNEALDTLHPEHKSVMSLRYKEQLSFEEIAAIMQRPMNTVKSWHRRALSKMRGYLSHRKGS